MASARVAIVLVAVLAGWMMLTGCQGQNVEEQAEAIPLVDPLNPPSGRVLQVWSNGDCTIDMGRDEGVEAGDWLSIMRNDDAVKYLEVTDAQATISYCRVAFLDKPERPRVDDVVLLEPKVMESAQNP